MLRQTTPVPDYPCSVSVLNSLLFWKPYLLSPRPFFLTISLSHTQNTHRSECSPSQHSREKGRGREGGCKIWERKGGEKAREGWREPDTGDRQLAAAVGEKNRQLSGRLGRQLMATEASIRRAGLSLLFLSIPKYLRGKPRLESPDKSAWRWLCENVRFRRHNKRQCFIIYHNLVLMLLSSLD